MRSTLLLLGLLLAAGRVAGQAVPRPIAAISAGAGSEGLSASLEASPVSRVWIVGSASTGFSYGMRSIGARWDVLRQQNGAIYIQPLLAETWCRNNTEAYCPFENVRRTGLSASVGLDLALNTSFSVGLKAGGWTGFKNDVVSEYLRRWHVAGVVRLEVR